MSYQQNIRAESADNSKFVSLPYHHGLVFSKYINMEPDSQKNKAHSASKSDFHGNRSPELEKLYEKLKQTDAQLKAPITDRPPTFSMPDNQEEKPALAKSSSWKRLKEEEMKKMREERLEKLRNDNTPESEITFPQTNGFKFSLQKQNSSGRSQSPKFQNDIAGLKTLGGLLVEGEYEQEEINQLPELQKQFTAKFPGQNEEEDNEEKDETKSTEKSIDIARDIVGMHNRSIISKNKSFSSTYSQYNTEKYLQIKFYNRFFEREQANKLLNQKLEEDRKKLANSKKMTPGSYKIMTKKIETMLTNILTDIDKEGTKRITFEQLGRIFTLIGAFRIIQYDEDFNLENEEQFFSKATKDQKRRFEETE